MILTLLGAFATVPDLYGMGARLSGAGGGGIGLVDDGTAAYLNPAGLSRIRRPHAGLGGGIALHDFEPAPPVWWDTNRDGSLDARDAPLTVDANPGPAAGLHIEAGRNVGGRFGIGVSMYVPTNSLIEFELFEPSLPRYVMYDNRLQRFVGAAGIGGEIVDGVSIGASAELLANSEATVVMTVDATVFGAEEEGQPAETLIGDIRIDTHQLSLKLKPELAPILGIQLQPGKWFPALEGLTLAASYHGSANLDIQTEIDVQGNVTVADVGELDPYVAAIVFRSRWALVDHYVPPRITVGAAYERADTFSVYADARWSDWRRFILNVAQVDDAEISAPLLDLDDNVVDGNAFGLLVRPVWAVRLGTELHLPKWSFDSRFRYLRLTARGGFAYEPSPIVDQGDDTAILDGDRTTFTLGAGAEFWDPFALTDGAVRFDAFFQSHQIARRTLERASDVPRAGYPVDSTAIRSGGNIVVFGGQWSFDY